MKLEQCADKFKAVLSYLNFTKFHEYLNKYYPSKKFSFEQKKKSNTKQTILEVEMACEGSKFVTSVY